MKPVPFISLRVREMRIKKNLTQEEIGRRLGYTSHVPIAKLESGKKNITDKMLKRILIEGFDLKASEVKKLMGELRTEEAKIKFGIDDSDKLSSSKKPIDPPKPIEQIEEGLLRMKFDKKFVNKLIKELEEMSA